VAKAEPDQAPFQIAGQLIRAGERRRIDVPLPSLFTQTAVFLPVHVVHGRRPGPILFVTAAVHGDEINGIAIIRRLLASTQLKNLRGTLLAVPVVNVYGFDALEYLLYHRGSDNACPAPVSIRPA